MKTDFIRLKNGEKNFCPAWYPEGKVFLTENMWSEHKKWQKYPMPRETARRLISISMEMEMMAQSTGSVTIGRQIIEQESVHSKEF